MGEVASGEGLYSLADRDHRAEYANFITAALAGPYPGPDEEKMAQTLEAQVKIVQLIGPLSTFLQSAESHWLKQRPDGVVHWP